MVTTDYLKLKKPDEAEKYDIGVQNDNMDSIDKKIKAIDEEVKKKLSVDGNSDNNKVTFSETSVRQNIESGETHKIIFGKIKKFFTDLKTVAFTGSYTDLSDTPEVDSTCSRKSQNAISNSAITYYLETIRDTLETRIGANTKDITNLQKCVYDTGWKSVECGNGISAWSSFDAPRIRRVGKTVELVGIITNSTSFADHDSLFRNIPEDMRPSRNVWSIQQGDIKNKTTARWMMTINPEGTVSFNYYGFSGPLTISKGMCIPVHAVWMVD
nr:MAG TPA: receptor binding protein [Caudoviricetes sp.]